MTSYTSQPNIPTLSPVDIFTDDEEPFRDKMNKVYTDIVNISNDKKRKEQYLQQEDITIDTWVNGKAIFRQTFPTGTLSASSNNSIATGISSIDDIVVMWGEVKNGSTSLFLPYVDPTDNTKSIGLSRSSNSINIKTGAGMPASFSGYITIYYTKT